jgi:hypothetical protein
MRILIGTVTEVRRSFSEKCHRHADRPKNSKPRGYRHNNVFAQIFLWNVIPYMFTRFPDLDLYPLVASVCRSVCNHGVQDLPTEKFTVGDATQAPYD